jgi:hypothetical protein
MTSSNPKIIYVTREIERALGMAPNENYLIVSNKTPYGETVKKQYPDFVTLVDTPAGKLLGTGELLSSAAVEKLMTANPGAHILVFKNTLRVEAIIKAKKWNVINPRSDLSERIENKLSQVRWLGPLAQRFLPPHACKVSKYITWKNSDPFIIQWGHGHTGDGTILVRTPDDLRAVQERFPERMARITAFVNGPSFTVNAVAASDKILMGNISYQITGLQPFTDNSFSTIGNDWTAARKLLGNDGIAAIQNMVTEIGNRLRTDGWKGLFGVDVIRDDARNRFYLIEINARQPASTTFESFLQEEERKKGAVGLTTFEAHLRALLDQPIDQNIIEIKDGAQIVQRVTKNVQSMFDDVAADLGRIGYSVVSYQNNTPNSDLLRVQSGSGIMDDHNSFNQKGHEIIDAIKNSHFKIEV